MKYVLIGGIVILIAFLTVLAFIPLGIEPLTEVYFENHTTLPAYLFLNRPYNFTFTVHNLEYQEMAYNYTVEVYDENDTFLYELDSGRIYLVNNESTSRFEKFTMKKPFGRVKININIKKDDLRIVPDFKKKLWWPDPNYPEEIDIHLWVEEITGPKIIITPD
ncbi:hypothetical protein A3K64_04160 [Candidatus Micrarchaeota archaeon RBG_16_36_9]|nr:MAG: hypothetical protein A3K64_04160 [Candidatus Micrarchaeota archaeon RBG_16_36_9]